MGTLPKIIQEDIRQFDRTLRQLQKQSSAVCSLLVDQGGFLITAQGESRDFDLTTISALAAGAYLANLTIASLVSEPGFESVVQEGEQFSLLVTSVDGRCLLIVIFQARTAVGTVKYFSAPAARSIARQLKKATERNPDAGLDLSVLNQADARAIFRTR